MWISVVMAKFTKLPSQAQGGTHENTNLSQGKWCPAQDSTQAPPEYKSHALLLGPNYSVIQDEH